MATANQPDDKDFLVEKILKNYTGIYDKPTVDRLALIRRDKVFKPVIYIGTGSCGIISGAGKTLEAIHKYLETNSIDADVIKVGCRGLCSYEPLMEVQLPGKSRVAFFHVTDDLVEDILDGILHYAPKAEVVLGQVKHPLHEDWKGLPLISDHPFFARQHRVILNNAGVISPYSLNDYIATGGYKALYKTVLNYTPEKVCDIIDLSELRGRGGGGFPTGKKLMVALNTGSDQKYLVCNADESDPGAFMNRAIIESDPHRIIEGIAIASYAIGAKNAFIYIRSDYTHSKSLLASAIAGAKEYGFLGENIFKSGFNLTIHIRQGAGAFVCGEETALIASIEGFKGYPRAKPPYPAESGIGGHPTVVNNVETLANIPSIIENGPQWYKSIGTKESKGTKVFSISGKSTFRGFVEIPMGSTLSVLVNDIAAGVRNEKKLKAVQLGGPSGICIPASELDIQVGFESLQEIGFSIGLGGMIILDEDTCMVNLSKYFMGFLQKESCGKCIPCREGTRRMLQILEEVTRRPLEGSTHETLQRFKGVVELENLAEVIRDTSLCGLGQNAPNPVLSSLKWFREEYEEHIFDRRCKAGICRDLRTFSIQVDACTGCNICFKKCPENAIIGTVHMPHFIVSEKCNGCGICFDVCKFNAITIK